MADEAQLEILNEGVYIWNAYRKANAERPINLQGANLSRASLHGADLSGANLRGADLSRASLQGANLTGAALIGANLLGADLSEASLYGANLRVANLIGAVLLGANLRAANLTGAHLRGVILRGADLTGASLLGADITGSHIHETTLANVDLGHTKGLNECFHHGPSILDMRTLRLSWPLPIAFLQGCGFEDAFIEQIPGLIRNAMPFCFISYADKDDEFTRRLYLDLQSRGVRCWFAPGDVKTEGRLHLTIDDVLRGGDKLLLVLSAASIAKQWMETEVGAAFEAEARRGETVLYPISVDQAVTQAQKSWVGALRRKRSIGDFTNWREPERYRQALERLLDDLRPKQNE